MAELQPVVIINAVGLTAGLVELAAAGSALASLAGKDGAKRIQGAFPGLTLPAQATMLTGLSPGSVAPVEDSGAGRGMDSLSQAIWQSQQRPPSGKPLPARASPGHGVVANGWYRPDLGEVRFWSQSHRQIQGETLPQAARRLAATRGTAFSCAHLFWWFAQGAGADWMLTPKPHYGADGSKAFDVLSEPSGLAEHISAEIGPFPFPAFWGPMSGLKSSQWIAKASAEVIRDNRPTLSLVYLPHIDYDLQRFGPGGLGETGLRRLVAELDGCVSMVLDAAKAIGAAVMVTSEYGIVDVKRAVMLNRALRMADLLSVRYGPFGEMLDPMGSAAFAVCDHQIAHVHCRDAAATEKARAALHGLEGVGQVLDRQGQAALDMAHGNSGDLLVLAKPDAWFAYPYWLDDKLAPDFARTIDIHRKPGYDPCELFFDPNRTAPKLRFAAKLALKKLGFRALLDVIPLDPGLVKGSHGLPDAQSPGSEHAPVCLSTDAKLRQGIDSHADFKSAILRHWALA